MAFLNCMPIHWSTKRQATVESSTYGSKLVVARIATEMVIEMRNNLCALGIPVNKPSYMFRDNMSMVANTTLPSSSLKKKHNTIACLPPSQRSSLQLGSWGLCMWKVIIMWQTFSPSRWIQLHTRALLIPCYLENHPSQVKGSISTRSQSETSSKVMMMTCSNRGTWLQESHLQQWNIRRWNGRKSTCTMGTRLHVDSIWSFYSDEWRCRSRVFH